MFRSPPPRVKLVNGFLEPFDNAIATARTCYSPRIVSAADVHKDERALALRDRIAQETYQAGHHTILQHATFQFTLENVSRQAIWSFLHSHPFYNSEQVSQRYVEVRPENVVVPELPDREERLYRSTVEAMGAAYHELMGLVGPKVAEEFYRIFPARKRTPDRWAPALKKRAQEVARYVLPVGTFAHLYHTVSGLTLHRYHRLCRQLDVPEETHAVVKAMVAEVNRVDPDFFAQAEDPIPLEETLEHRTLKDLGRLEVGGPGARAFVDEFDRKLGKACSQLVDYPAKAQESLAEAVRAVLGVAQAVLPQEEAIRRVLDPGSNPYWKESLSLEAHAKLTRALAHVHYTFRKKLSHTADSQDQRHRTTPGSRPVLWAHFVPGRVDAVVPALVQAVPAAREKFFATLEGTWRAIEQLLDAGVGAEKALYLLPNAFPIRFLESGDLLGLRHKWVHRLCYTAQEEIWRASVEEVTAVGEVHPRLAQYLRPPCTLRREAQASPLCPEGPRYCGVPVWNLELSDFTRLI